MALQDKSSEHCNTDAVAQPRRCLNIFFTFLFCTLPWACVRPIRTNVEFVIAGLSPVDLLRTNTPWSRQQMLLDPQDPGTLNNPMEALRWPLLSLRRPVANGGRARFRD